MSVRCWKCGSKNITVTVMNEQSYSIGKGVAGTLLFGPGGAAMGVNGKSEEKKKYVCQACGEISSSCMDPGTVKHIEESIAENSFMLPTLKKSYPNIEWDETKDPQKIENQSSTLNTEIQRGQNLDLEALQDVLAMLNKPMSWSELRNTLARETGINEDQIAPQKIVAALATFVKDGFCISFMHKKIAYYVTDVACLSYMEELVEEIEYNEEICGDVELALRACETVLEKYEFVVMKDKMIAAQNRLNELLEISKAYDFVVDTIKHKVDISSYEKAIQILNKTLIPIDWKDSEDLYTKCQENLEELKRMKLRESRRANGLCPYCGGDFKGLFTKTCARCGRKKDY